MHRFESVPSKSTKVNPEIVDAQISVEVDTRTIDLPEGAIDRQEMKDFLFDQYMKQKLIEDFFNELEEYLEFKDVDQMRAVLSTYSDEDVYAGLSLPSELRKRKFNEFKEKIQNGDSDPGELMRGLVEISKKYQFGIGYHISPNDIRPTPEGEWKVRGTEPDHRDNDVNMAYYSTKYRHLFRKKNPNYVYIVRTEPVAHKTDGIWSRAGSLSIIAKVPYKDVINYVESTVSKEIKEISNKKAADKMKSAAN